MRYKRLLTRAGGRGGRQYRACLVEYRPEFTCTVVPWHALVTDGLQQVQARTRLCAQRKEPRPRPCRLCVHHNEGLIHLLSTMLPTLTCPADIVLCRTSLATLMTLDRLKALGLPLSPLSFFATVLPCSHRSLGHAPSPGQPYLLSYRLSDKSQTPSQHISKGLLKKVSYLSSL